MGLAVRVIPTLLMRGDQLVKGRQFNAWRTVGHIEQAARICGQRAVDEIVLLDIGATPEGRGPDFDCIARIAENFHTPLTVGGGVRSVEDFQALLNAGADKVAIGEAAPIVVYAVAKRYGAQAVVVAIDVDSRGMVAWTGHTPSNLSPVVYARKMEQEGAGEILLTSIEREGTMHGYDLELIGAVSRAVGIPVIAHGGCSGYPDMLAAIKAGASAVAAGALFQFTEATPREAAEWLAGQGVETRVPA